MEGGKTEQALIKVPLRVWLYPIIVYIWCVEGINKRMSRLVPTNEGIQLYEYPVFKTIGSSSRCQSREGMVSYSMFLITKSKAQVISCIIHVHLHTTQIIRALPVSRGALLQ